MTEENTPSSEISEQQPAKPVRTLEALLRLYAEGHRNFSGSDLRGVTVDNIDKEIKYLDLREIIFKGSNLKAVVLNRSYLKVDLTGSDLSDCNLQGVNLSHCRLDQCNFRNSDLRKSNLDHYSCRGSDFIQTKLQNIVFYAGADFTASNLTGSDFRGSSVAGNFSHVNFCGSNFQRAIFHHFSSEGADFSDSDLRSLNLETCVSFKYSYYNNKTKFSENFDPIGMGMELLTDEKDEPDSED